MMVGISPVRNSPAIRRRKRRSTFISSAVHRSSRVHRPALLCGMLACLTLALICAWQTRRSAAAAPTSIDSKVHHHLRAPNNDSDPEFVFDVIVVGSGLAGLSATLQILDRGGRVALIEKEDTLGGNSLKASSGINSCCGEVAAQGDSLDAFILDTTKSAGSLARPVMIQELVGSSADALTWLKDRVGVDLSRVAQLGGHSFPRTHRPVQGMVGAELIVNLEQLIRTYAQHPNSSSEGYVTIYTQHSVTKLIQHKNQITGVQARNTKTNITTVMMAPQVLLATGGFASDRSPTSLLGRVRPDLIHFGTTGGSFSTGDGIVLATAVGAQTTDLDEIQLHPTGFVDPLHPHDTTKVLAAELLRGVGGILLHEGMRFCNELGTRDYVTQKMLQAKAKNNAFVLMLTEQAAQQAHNHVEMYRRKGLLTRVQGVVGLAEWTQVSPQRLLNAFQEYQAAMDLGEDSFGKSVFPGFPATSSRNDWDQQVFFVGMVTPTLHYCMGGLTIDVNAHVLNKEGGIIQGLYAAGEVAGGVHGANRLGGNSLLECTVFGRKIGLQVALQQSHSSIFIPSHHRLHAETNWDTNTIVTMEELQQHATKNDLWMALHGVVYNLTAFARQHPGGATILETLAGADATEAFATVHSKHLLQQFNAEPSVVMGKLDSSAGTALAEITRTVARSELAQHATLDDCWVAFHGQVYDMTDFSKHHKGGAYLIQKYAGKDATKTYKVFHKKDKLGLVAKYRIGMLAQEAAES